jgi:hypothetical protein
MIWPGLECRLLASRSSGSKYGQRAVRRLRSFPDAGRITSNSPGLPGIFSTRGKAMNILRKLFPTHPAPAAQTTATAAAPVATKVHVKGMGMVRVLDASTGKVLGFRRTYREACWLAAALERGENLQRAG